MFKRPIIWWIVQLTACVGLYALVPGTREHFVREDGVVEVLGALFFLLAAIVSVFALVRWRGRVDRRLLLATFTLGAVGFLDEVSFGARLFDIQFPAIRGKTIDGAHDFVGVALDLARSYKPAAAVVALALLAVFIRLVYVYRRPLLHLLDRARHEPPLRALATFAVLLTIAIGLDAHLVSFPHEMFVEELIELNAAMFLVASAVLAARPVESPAAGRGASSGRAAKDDRGMAMATHRESVGR